MSSSLRIAIAVIVLSPGCDELKRRTSEPSKQPPPATVYRYRGKDGTLHYTDDKSSIPQGAKIEETRGSDIKVVEASKVERSPTLVGSESQWRVRFAEKKKLIAQLEELVAHDEPIAGVGEHNALLEESKKDDSDFRRVLERLRDNRAELERQKAALQDLHRVADGAKVPQDWR